MKQYNVIYADPPWSYNNKKTGGSMISGASSKYPTMSINQLAEMPIRDITEKDAVCFMWVTVPLLPEGLSTLNAWGFKYKTMITWRKVMSLGMGFWFRGQCEHLVLGTKGKVKAFRMQVPNFHQCKVEKHSQKPHHFRELISKAVQKSFSEVNKLELFARSEYEGWDVYGNEVNNSITLIPLTKS